MMYTYILFDAGLVKLNLTLVHTTGTSETSSRTSEFYLLVFFKALFTEKHNKLKPKQSYRDFPVYSTADKEVTGISLYLQQPKAVAETGKSP